MLVHELMTRNVHSVTPEAGLDEALRSLVDHSISSVPVVSASGVVVGILSEADLLTELVVADPRAHLRPPPPEDRPHQTVLDVMTRGVHVARTHDDVADVARLMVEHRWNSVPVVTGDQLVGMVSRSDVVRALARPDLDSRTDLLSRLAEFGHPTWEVSVVHGRARVDGPRTAAERRIADSAALSVVGIHGLAT